MNSNCLFIDISKYSEKNYFFADNTTFENFKHLYINNDNTFFQKQGQFIEIIQCLTN